jgi:hypothetical protein
MWKEVLVVKADAEEGGTRMIVAQGDQGSEIESNQILNNL